MQLNFIFKNEGNSDLHRFSGPSVMLLNGRPVPLLLVRNRRARRYVLRMRKDGAVRVTIPRGGTMAYGRSFAEKNRTWLEAQWARLATMPERRKPWIIGTEILLRGELVTLQEARETGVPMVRLGELRFSTPGLAALARADLRLSIERNLWDLAARELPPRVFELASMHGLTVKRVTVRNQKSRWGSCSRRGTVSLNWRLIQAPAFVRDYICLHELMHLRQMNHSKLFWHEVERVCPGYRQAEAWLKTHRDLLGT